MSKMREKFLKLVFTFEFWSILKEGEIAKKITCSVKDFLNKEKKGEEYERFMLVLKQHNKDPLIFLKKISDTKRTQKILGIAEDTKEGRKRGVRIEISCPYSYQTFIIKQSWKL